MLFPDKSNVSRFTHSLNALLRVMVVPLSPPMLQSLRSICFIFVKLSKKSPAESCEYSAPIHHKSFPLKSSVSKFTAFSKPVKSVMPAFSATSSVRLAISSSVTAASSARCEPVCLASWRLIAAFRFASGMLTSSVPAANTLATPMLMTIITASRTARLRLIHDCFVVVIVYTSISRLPSRGSSILWLAIPNRLSKKFLPLLRRILDTAHGLLLLLFLVRRPSCELALLVYSFCVGGRLLKVSNS